MIDDGTSILFDGKAIPLNGAGANLHRWCDTDSVVDSVSKSLTLIGSIAGVAKRIRPFRNLVRGVSRGVATFEDNPADRPSSRGACQAGGIQPAEDLAAAGILSQ